MSIVGSLFLLGTGLLAAYLCWYFYQRHARTRALHNLYYRMGFAVFLVSGLLLIASLIPLGISMGLAEEYFPSWKNAYKWFALRGFLAILVSSIGGLDTLKKTTVPLFHGVAGLVIFPGHLLAKNTPRGFWWVSVGRLLIAFSPAFVLLFLTPLLFLRTGSYALGFTRRRNLTAVGQV